MSFAGRIKTSTNLKRSEERFGKNIYQNSFYYLIKYIMNKTQLIELLQALLELMKDDEFMEELENHSHKICPLCGFDCEDDDEEDDDEEDDDWEEVTETVVTPESKAEECESKSEECIHLENIIDHLCSAF